MLENKVVTYIYIFDEDQSVLMAKKSLGYDYSFNLESVTVHKVNGNVDITNPKTLKELGFQCDSINEKNREKKDILRARIETFLLLKTNIEMHKETIDEYYRNECWKELLDKQLEKFLKNEKRQMLLLLKAKEEKYLSEINKIGSIIKIREYYLKIKSSVVLGSFVRVNKLKEEVDE